MTPKITGYLTTTDQTKLYYECYGDSGPIIIMTYGIACLMNHWRYQVEDFSKDHRVMIYDMRGHHKSELGDLPITIDLLVNDTVELLDHVYSKSERAHFWGHSFGAPISLRCASLFPDRVHSSVLINGFFKNPFGDFLTDDQCFKVVEGLHTFVEHAPNLSQWMWNSVTGSVVFHYLAGVTGGFNLERVSYKDIEIYSKGLGCIPLHNFLENFKALVTFDGTEHIKTTLAPVLVIQGERDGIVPGHLNEYLAENLPNGQMKTFPEGSHCTQLDLPGEVNSSIREFMHNI
jgi:pimeloyl-ACP methyl ester carboxylesterase